MFYVDGYATVGPKVPPDSALRHSGQGSCRCGKEVDLDYWSLSATDIPGAATTTSMPVRENL
jgi:hypothetical protein